MFTLWNQAFHVQSKLVCDQRSNQLNDLWTYKNQKKEQGVVWGVTLANDSTMTQQMPYPTPTQHTEKQPIQSSNFYALWYHDKKFILAGSSL